jgi:hypothetical protein
MAVWRDERKHRAQLPRMLLFGRRGTCEKFIGAFFIYYRSGFILRVLLLAGRGDKMPQNRAPLFHLCSLSFAPSITVYSERRAAIIFDAIKQPELFHVSVCALRSGIFIAPRVIVIIFLAHRLFYWLLLYSQLHS